MDPLAFGFEVVQSLAAAGAIALAAAAWFRSGGRHAHGEPPALPVPVEAPAPVVKAPLVEVSVAPRGPIASSRKPAPKAAPVCECGHPGKACRVHGAR
jgi:hypothetical protein